MNQIEIEDKDVTLLVAGLKLLKKETIANLLSLPEKRNLVLPGKDYSLVRVYARIQNLLDSLNEAKAKSQEEA